MREIKFRAFDEEIKEIVEPYEIDFSLGYAYYIDSKEDVQRVPIKNILQYTGLKDKNGTPIFEGDIIGVEGVYHFLDRKGWEARTGNWKIIGEKIKNFTGKEDERYIAGYELSVVEWNEKSCGFEPFSDSEDNCGHCGGGEKSTNFEVIGNLYQNPELLK